MIKETTCADLDRALIASAGSSKDAIPPNVQAHLAECERCCSLVQALNHQEDFQLPSDVLHRLQAPILNGLKPVRPLPPTWVFMIVFLLIFLVIVGIGIDYLGAFGWADLTGFQRTVIFSSLAASAALLAFSTVRQMQPGSRNFFSPALLPVAVIVLLSLAVASVFQYESDPHFVRVGMGCLEAGIPFAIPSGLLFWFILTRGAVLHRYVAGGTAGMLAGLIGTSVLEVHCPIFDIGHILVWHVGVCVAGSLAGLLAAYVGDVIRRWQEFPPQRPR